MLSALLIDRRSHDDKTVARRRRLALLGVLAAVLAGFVAVAPAPPAGAAQATGDDVPVWATGSSWTYATTFHYVADGTDVSLNEDVTYAVAATQTFAGQDAYRLNITGTITGGSGSAQVDGVGNVSLSNFRGSVSGTRYVRRSDLALLQETQHQDLTGTAKLGILSQGITATIDLQMTPQQGWRVLDFPLDAGQGWHNGANVDYTGGFDYQAGSIASGSSPFDGTFVFDQPASVTNGTASVPAGNISTRVVTSHSSDGTTIDDHWYSPAHKYDARELLQLPLDNGTLTIDRKLSTSAVPASGGITETITPSLSCAGGDVTVSGKVSSGAAGVPVSISLDRSPVSAGASTTASATTTSGGNYSATLQAPAASDGMSKSGARASWGVLVSGGGGVNAATLVVTPQDCTTLTYDGATSAAQGDTVTAHATLVDLAGGSVAGRTVTFSLAGGAAVDATTNSAGVAQANLSAAGPPRSTIITATFAGTSDLTAASSTAAFTVGTIPTTTAVVADPPVVTVGDGVRFTATVTPAHGATPQGSVQFNVDGADFGAAVPLSGGSATSPALSTLPLGNHTVTASYGGSADDSPSTSAAFTFRVREPLKPTSTTSSAAPSSAVHGQDVTLSASVSAATGTPTGEVVFKVGATEVGRAPVSASGDASVTVTDLPVGSNAVVATYTGDDVYDASSAAPRTVNVAKADVSVTLGTASTHTVAGQAVAYTATVAVEAPGGGTPDGTVQLAVDGTDVGAPVTLSNGAATFPAVSSLGAGSHTVKATYSGSADYAGGADQLQQTVTQADTTTTVVATPSPSVQDQNVQLRAVVSAVAPGAGSPTGTVTFLSDGDPVGSAPLTASGAGSTATLDLSDLAPGSHQVVARYAGDSDYRASDSEAISHTVIEGTAVVETSTALSSSENPSTYGSLITFRAHVTAADGSAPAGSVQFSVDGTDVGDPVPVDGDGVAESPALASPDPGDHTVIAAFRADTGYTGSGDILTQTVESAGVDVDLTSSAPDAEVGQGVTFTATVASQVVGTGTPTGYVQFSVDGQPLGDAVELADGTAHSPAVSDLTPGNHQVTALYSGDVDFAPRLVGIDQAVHRLATSTALQVTPTSPTYGDAVTLRATVTPAQAGHGTPTGAVQFTDGGTVLATVAVTPGSGGTAVATLTTSALHAGSHPLRASYVQDPVYASSDSPAVTVTVAKQATAMKADPAVVSLTPLGLPLGQLRVTLTGGVQPLPGAAVQFKVGTKVVCSATTDALGVATCNAASQLLNLVAAGGYTASFAGDPDHLSVSAHGAILK